MYSDWSIKGEYPQVYVHIFTLMVREKQGRARKERTVYARKNVRVCDYFTHFFLWKLEIHFFCFKSAIYLFRLYQNNYSPQ